jgi:hypothetical protein
MRTFADMATTNKIIEESISDPKALSRIRYRITHLAKDIIHLEEILGTHTRTHAHTQGRPL